MATAIQPCVGSRAEHQFIANSPEPGQFGHVIIFCTKCGRTPEQVAKPAPATTTKEN